MSTGEMAAAPGEVVSQKISKPVSNFSLFPKVPKELRTMVWKHTLPKSRIVTLAKFTTTLPIDGNQTNTTVGLSSINSKFGIVFPLSFVVLVNLGK
jgi:hypothetical protein